MKKLIAMVLILSLGCTNNQTTTQQAPAPTISPSASNAGKGDQAEEPTEPVNDEGLAKTAPDAEANNIPSVSPPDMTAQNNSASVAPAPADASKSKDVFKSSGPAVPVDTGLPSGPEKQTPGTPATNTAESTLNSSLNRNIGVNPLGSTLTYTSADLARIQYYKSFVAGKISTDDFARLLFKDPKFNRAVLVVGDLYRQDKLSGSIPPQTEVKFQELAQKVGDAVLIYNQQKRQEHYKNLAGSVIVGTLLGATAGGFFMKEEWVPQFVKTKLGDRIPGVTRDAIIGGVVGGTTVLLTTETYHVINDLANPDHAYNADPILDVPTR
jgi:hypothetical protein